MASKPILGINLGVLVHSMDRQARRAAGAIDEILGVRVPEPASEEGPRFAEDMVRRTSASERSAHSALAAP